MILNLTRTDFKSDGIFGELESEDGKLYLFTLEHAYSQNPDGIHGAQVWAPKIPQGAYICVRGKHQLEGMTEPFETFEITGVEGHTGLLFHKGNLDKDSSGCVLLGLIRSESEVLNSQGGFSKFMNFLNGVETFELHVS